MDPVVIIALCIPVVLFLIGLVGTLLGFDLDVKESDESKAKRLEFEQKQREYDNERKERDAAFNKVREIDHAKCMGCNKRYSCSRTRCEGFAPDGTGHVRKK